MTSGERAGKNIDLKIVTMKLNALQRCLRDELPKAETAYKSFLASRSAQDRTKYEDRLAYIAEIRKRIVDSSNEISSLIAELRDRQGKA